MHTFTDNQGRVWDVEINVTTLRRVRDLAKVNLTRILDDGFLDAFLEDAFQQADVLFSLCRDQAEERGVCDEDFGRALTGQAMESAQIAMLAELADFFPLRRALLEKIASRHRRLREIADARILQWIDDPATEATVLERIRRSLESHEASLPGGTSGNVPESSGSTPAPSP